ncbi:Rrf2 family transcriptional regulator [bacterium]|nr:Rrf2 family transcriptional regulator [candidate division CSSED10-310 bacterium]
MRVTTQGEYGLRCIINIGKNCHRGPVSIQFISDDEGLPRTYVEQLLLKLRRHKLIKSVRGAHGGYLLARPPETITVRQIIEALEGKIFEIVCERRARSRVKCKYQGEGVLRQIWNEIKSNLEELLDNYSLDRLIREEQSRYPDRTNSRTLSER